MKRPSDLGYDDAGYDLPKLHVHEHSVKGTAEQAKAQGMLFVQAAKGLTEQRQARRATLPDRVKLAVDVVAAEPDEPWNIWCELNDESDALAKSIDGAVEVRGSQKEDTKESLLLGFSDGTHKKLVSKGSICGHGMNWQHCARIVIVGVTHSFEQYYQIIRRNWRFGQTREVHCHVITSEIEGSVLDNLRRKEADAAKLSEEMRRYTAAIVRENIRGADRESDAYDPTVPMSVPAWLVSDGVKKTVPAFVVGKVKKTKRMKEATT